MIRFLFTLALLLAVPEGSSAKEFRFPAMGPDVGAVAQTLTIYSTVDIDIVKPLISAYQSKHRQIAIRYHDIQTLELYDRVIRETEKTGVTADFILSSAMDLQMKLANDGFVQSWTGPEAVQLPRWARWRNEAFGVTFEPAVIIYNKLFFANKSLPKSHSDLMALLEKRKPAWFGKIATYDAERSGLGFLFLARDVEHYKDIWRLYRLFGENGAKLYSRSQAIIDRVADGRFILGYNLLGSYAAAQSARDERIGIILPQDYTVVMLRIALIPRAARNPELGGLFLSFVLSTRGQKIIAGPMHMNAVSRLIPGAGTARALRARHGASLRPIRVGPGLLVYHDRAKRQLLLKQWNAALAGK